MRKEGEGQGVRGPPHLSLGAGASMGLPVWCWISQWRCQHVTPNSSLGPPSQSGFVHPDTGATMAPPSWDHTPVPVWVLVWDAPSQCRTSSQNGTSNSSLGPPPQRGTRTGSLCQHRALIPVQVQTWGSPFHYRIPILGPHPSLGAGMGPPILVQDTPSRHRVPIPVQVLVPELPPSTGCPSLVWVLGWDTPHQYGGCCRPLTSGHTPGWVPCPGLGHPEPVQGPIPVGTPLPVWDAPCQDQNGAVMGSSSQ